MIQAAPTSPSKAGAVLSTRYTLYTVSLMTVIYAINLFDRQMPFIMAEAIKKDLGLSDTQLGIMGGFAFSLCYAGFSLPLARLSDRWSPKWVLAGAAASWSLTTACAALTRSFIPLAITRALVAVGEAGCVPASHALISAMSTPRNRGVILTIFMVGPPVGLMAGLALGGWLGELWGWRTAFMVVGLFGLVVALVFALSVPDVRPAPVEDRGTLAQGARHMLRSRTYRHIFIGMNLLGLAGYSVVTFAPPFLIRSFALSPSYVGLWLGMATGVGGGLGTLVGGLFAEAVGRDRPALRLWIPAISLFIAALCYAGAFIATSSTLSIGLLGCALCLQAVHAGPCYAAAQTLAPPHLRATSAALLVIASALLGASLGPLIVGMISDVLMPTLGASSLRYAMLAVVPLGVAWTGLHFGLAAAAFETDFQKLGWPQRAQEQSSASDTPVS